MKRFAYLVLLFIGLTGCTDVIDLDLSDTEILLVVEGEINDVDSVQWVQLSYTTDYFNNVPPDYTVESNAIIKLYENDALIDSMTYNPNTARFESYFQGTRGNTYSIEIVTEDGETYTSTKEILTEVTPIDTIWVAEETNFGETEQVVYIETAEIPGIGNYYQWKVYINGEYQDEPFDMIFAEDQFVDGNYIEEFDIYALSEEDILFYTSFSDSIHVRIEQTGISQNHYNFLADVFAQTAIAGGPFSPPPAEVRSNITNTSGGERALGIFTVVSIEDISITFAP